MLGSISFEMTPDIALETDRAIYLLDPKFKAYDQPRSEQADILRMHGYRDAIRGAKCVENAWCLFVGDREGRSGPIICYPKDAGPFGTAGVGAIWLRPGASRKGLDDLLAHLLGLGKTRSEAA